MLTTPPHPLDYASPKTQSGGRPFLRSVLAVCALVALVVNPALVRLSVENLHAAHWAYRELRLDSKAYGREVTPASIASLRRPYTLWVSHALLVAAAAFGLLLALHLLVLIWQMNRRPDSASRRMRQYLRWKPFGSACTAVAFFAALSAYLNFWVTATRHHPVGAGPPIIETALLMTGAILPWWWLGKGANKLPMTEIRGGRRGGDGQPLVHA